MPQLKQLSCCVQWAETNAPFKEEAAHYGDGVVETYIIIPERPQRFCVRLTSHGFIYEGLAMVVYMDGRYQCNRNRMNLKVPKKGEDNKATEIDFLVRQQETTFGGGSYVGREWRFDEHLEIDHPATADEIAHFEDLGTIEILVLRCRPANTVDGEYEGSSSGADSHISKSGEERTETQDAGDIPAAETSKATEIEPDGMMFGFGLFDGANDFEPPPYDGPPDSHGRYVWQQTHPPSTQDFTNVHNIDHHGYINPQHGPSPSHHGAVPPMQDGHHTQYPTHPPQMPRQYPHGPHQAHHPQSKHVHFEQGFQPPQAPPSQHFPQENTEPGYMQPPSQSAPLPAQQPSMYNQHEVPHSYTSPYPPQQFYPRPFHLEPGLSQSGLRRHAQDGTFHGNGRQGSQTRTRTKHNSNAEWDSNSQQSHSANIRPNNLEEQQNTSNSDGNGNAGQRRNSSLNHQTSDHQQRRSSQQFEQNHAQHAHNMSTNGRNTSNPEQMHQPMPYHQYPQPGISPYPQPYHGQFYGYPQQAQFLNMMPPWSMPPYGMYPPEFYPPQGHRPDGRMPSVDTAASPKTGCVNCATPHEDPQVNNDDQNAGNNDDFNNDNPGDVNQNDTNDTNWPDAGGTNNDTTGNDSWNQDYNNNNGDFNTSDNNNNNNNGFEANAGEQNNDPNNWNKNDNSGGNNDWPQNDANNNDNGRWPDANDSNANANDSGAKDNTKTDGVAAKGEVPRNLSGPLGTYLRTTKPSEDEPQPFCEEAAPYDVPKTVVQAKFGSWKQVQPGPGYKYYKKRSIPEYIDTLDQPYARFVFKYRTKAQYELETGNQLDVEPSSDQEVTELQNLDKQELIEMLIRAKGKLGGKIPSPPVTPIPDSNEMPGTFPVQPPKRDHLRYSLPPLPTSHSGSRTASGATEKSRKSSSSNNMNKNNDNSSRPAWDTSDGGQQTGQNVDWSAPTTWDGQAEKAKGHDRRASKSSSKTIKAAGDQGTWDIPHDSDPPRPPPPPPPGSSANDWNDNKTNTPTNVQW